MKAAVNAKRKYQGLEPLKAADFMKLMREKTRPRRVRFKTFASS